MNKLKIVQLIRTLHSIKEELEKSVLIESIEFVYNEKHEVDFLFGVSLDIKTKVPCEYELHKGQNQEFSIGVCADEKVPLFVNNINGFTDIIDSFEILFNKLNEIFKIPLEQEFWNRIETFKY